MTARHAHRFALWLLDRFVPDSQPLAGDLVEEVERRSAFWFWWQVAAAITAAALARGVEIRPLRLVELQPADALERSRRLRLRFPPVNLAASPVAGVGGLGLVIFAGLVTIFMPVVWLLLLASVLAGVVLGIAIIIKRGATASAARLPLRVLAI
jgi:hypothetical protein